MQQLKRIKPVSINTDIDETLMQETEARFLKNYRIGFNVNANLQTGTGDGAPQGSNFGVDTPLQSTIAAAPSLQLPVTGKNFCIGTYECQETNEIYWFNYNSAGNHGIYRINGATGAASAVYIGSCLNFSHDPRFTTDNRVFLKVVYDSDLVQERHVRAKYLLFTDGLNWQRWIDVETSAATDSFNSVLYPYFAPVPPLYDPCELINLAVSPPFLCPSTELVPFTQADVGKYNNLLYKSVQFAYQFLYRDGRASVFSPYSVNVYVGDNSCAELATNNPRCVKMVLSAGGPLVEKIRVFFRNCGGDWLIYDTIDKYDKCDTDVPFYNRGVALPQYQKDTNAFTYVYCGDKECGAFSVEDAGRLQNDVPLKSFALTPVGNSILLANNLYFYNNYDCDTLDNISIKIGEEDQSASCAPQNVTLTAWVVATGAPVVRKKDEKAVFGNWIYLPFVNSQVKYDGGGSGTFFENDTGFIGYLAGTPYATIGKQYRVDPEGNRELIDQVLDWSDGNVQNAVINTLSTGGYYIFKFEFVVPKGNYIFRLASNETTLEDINYQRTSTYVAYGGSYTIGSPYGLVFPDKNYAFKEIFFRGCNGNVDSQKDMNMTLNVIAPILGGINREKIITGYVTDTSNADRKGMELLQYVMDAGAVDSLTGGVLTDHNGFYFARCQNLGANSAEVVFWGEYNCVMTTRSNPFLRTTTGRRPQGMKRFKQDIAVQDATGSYKPCNDIRVLGKVVDQNGAPLAGVNVVITRGNTALTNSDGEFTLKVHRGDQRIYDNVDYIVIGASGKCSLLSEDCSCVPVFPYQPSKNPSNCNCNVPRIYPDFLNIVLRYADTGGRSLKGGGRYGFAITGRDAAGRQTFANNFDYVDIPTFLQKNNFSPTLLSWQVTDEFTLPADTKYISFYRTKNLNFGTYIQWVGDKIEFLNARGEKLETVEEAVRAKIYIQSLLDFNTENNFATTVGYQFVPGDMLRIYDNGDGVLFSVNASTPYMDYQILGSDFNQSVAPGSTDGVPDEIDGKSFIIAYDKRLNALKDKCSFWIEIVRPHQCLDRELYYEICGSYAVKDGKLVGGIKSGPLPTWDTYYQYRAIHPIGCAAKAINHPFESASITDYWGANCESNGRVTVSDPQTYQQWYSDDVIKSDDFVNEGRVNGLGDFREANRKSFKGQEWGGIVAMHAERSIVSFVCQNDWFLTDYNMNYIRSGPGGLVVVNLTDSLSEPHQKIGYTYGCEYEDNSSIIFDDGLVVWADRKNANIVAMDYRNADDLAKIDNKSYFVSKFRHVIQFNQALAPGDYLDNLIEIVARKDPKYNEYVITFRPRQAMSQDMDSFVNVERETRLEVGETFVFNLDQQKWVRFTGYVPERYGTLRHSASGIELVAFANGLPYFLNSNVRGGTFDEFFGIETEQVISVILSFDPAKVKIFQSVVVESNDMAYFADMLFTEDLNSFSYIPLGYWDNKENVWYSTILRDMNSYQPLDKPYVSTLIDGKRIFGKILYLRLVRDTSRNKEYNEFNQLWIRIIASEMSEK